MSCKCQGCGRQYKVDLMVDNKLWKQITPKPEFPEGGLLCGHCIVDKLESNGYSAYRLEEIK